MIILFKVTKEDDQWIPLGAGAMMIKESQWQLFLEGLSSRNNPQKNMRQFPLPLIKQRIADQSCASVKWLCNQPWSTHGPRHLHQDFWYNNRSNYCATLLSPRNSNFLLIGGNQGQTAITSQIEMNVLNPVQCLQIMPLPPFVWKNSREWVKTSDRQVPAASILIPIPITITVVPARISMFQFQFHL